MTGKELKELRLLIGLGLTQKQAAEMAGVSVRTWQNWESGKHRVPHVVECFFKDIWRKEVMGILKGGRKDES